MALEIGDWLMVDILVQGARRKTSLYRTAPEFHYPYADDCKWSWRSRSG